MSARHIVLPALLALAPCSASAQNIQAVVQVGSKVVPVTIGQSGPGNFVGVIQIGGAPKDTVNQSGLANVAAIGQAGATTSASVGQVGAFNFSVVGQFGDLNQASAIQAGAMNTSVISQTRH